MPPRESEENGKRGSLLDEGKRRWVLVTSSDLGNSTWKHSGILSCTILDFGIIWNDGLCLEVRIGIAAVLLRPPRCSLRQSMLRNQKESKEK
ncbi:hypothetical protein TNCV_2187821 [Trichonephila clavipes]|nr:hypothetical protein TNCV_2187821 [Trichonephila clavipes]